MRDSAQILRTLKDRLQRAQDRRDEASKRFRASTNMTIGIPGPSVVKNAFEEYSRALWELQKAIQDQNDFILRGVVPPDLDDQP